MEPITLIKQREGCRLQVYQDEKGLWTIGWGHLCKPGDPYHPYGPVRVITQQEADNLLARDIEPAEDVVFELVGVPLNDREFTALVSLVFNIGRSQFSTSTLLKKLNDGDREGAAEEFLKWNHEGGLVSNGLTKRRKIEKDIFLS
jgi:lysozyme